MGLCPTPLYHLEHELDPRLNDSLLIKLLDRCILVLFKTINLFIIFVHIDDQLCTQESSYGLVGKALDSGVISWIL